MKRVTARGAALDRPEYRLERIRTGPAGEVLAQRVRWCRSPRRGIDLSWPCRPGCQRRSCTPDAAASIVQSRVSADQRARSRCRRRSLRAEDVVLLIASTPPRILLPIGCQLGTGTAWPDQVDPPSATGTTSPCRCQDFASCGPVRIRSNPVSGRSRRHPGQLHVHPARDQGGAADPAAPQE